MPRIHVESHAPVLDNVRKFARQARSVRIVPAEAHFTRGRSVPSLALDCDAAGEQALLSLLARVVEAEQQAGKPRTRFRRDGEAHFEGGASGARRASVNKLLAGSDLGRRALAQRSSGGGPPRPRGEEAQFADAPARQRKQTKLSPMAKRMLTAIGMGHIFTDVEPRGTESPSEAAPNTFTDEAPKGKKLSPTAKKMLAAIGHAHIFTDVEPRGV